MRRLISNSNEKANMLLKEVLEVIRKKKEEYAWFNLPITDKLNMNIGTFKSVTALGSYNYPTHTISLNEILLEKGTDEEIKRVILHELVHACNIHGHRSKFKNTACNAQYYTGIKVLDDNFSFKLRSNTRKDRAKYVMTCQGCGQKIYRERYCELVAHTNRYKCSKCNSKFEVEMV